MLTAGTGGAGAVAEAEIHFGNSIYARFGSLRVARGRGFVWFWGAGRGESERGSVGGR